MKAMILAAGLGTRLGEITQTRPKILVDLGGMTLLEWILRKLKRSGADDIIINVHHLADMVEEEGEKIANRIGVKLSFSDEREKLLDTGGGLYKAREFFDNKPFILYNGDIVTDLDLNALYQYNLSTEADAALAIRYRSGNRFFLTDKNGLLAGWRNRQTGEEILLFDKKQTLDEIAFSAISVINSRVFGYMKHGVYTMKSIYFEIGREGLVNTFRHNDGYWLDIGSPAMLEEARKFL